jgi:hypothetical protein
MKTKYEEIRVGDRVRLRVGTGISARIYTVNITRPIHDKKNTLIGWGTDKPNISAVTARNFVSFAPDEPEANKAPEDKPTLHRLFRDQPDTPEGKYLVQRRDGTVVEWPSFVLGARDEAAEEALYAYATKAQELGYDSEYVEGVRRLAEEFHRYRDVHGQGDPDKGKHRIDDPETVAKMRKGKSA